MTARTLLKASSLKAGYGSRTVLEEIDLEIEAGEFLGIAGPNGSGKTTLIRVLSGIIPASDGRVLLEEVPLNNLPGRFRARKIAVVSQNPDRFLDLAVEDIVVLGRLPYFRPLQWVPSSRDRSVVDWSLKVTGTAGMRTINFQKLSGGEQQRVLIALALAQRPRLLLLDEPTQHLDLNYQSEIFSLLGVLNRNHGVTVAAVLHDLNLAAAYCRRMLFLKNGRIGGIGAPKDLLTPDRVREIFGLPVVVTEHPETGCPVVLPSAPAVPAPAPKTSRPLPDSGAVSWVD